MTRALVVAALAAGALAATATPAGATTECDGLPICVPVAGPWVSVAPANGVEFQLSCPRGFVVAGLDSELSVRPIDVWFRGLNGSPVSPGRTTAREAIFGASYVGEGAPAPTFRPHVGCVPTSGGGSRIPTAVGAYPPARAVVRRVRDVFLKLGRQHVTLGCPGGERLVGGTHAVGFFSTAPPSGRAVRSVAVTRALRGGHVVVDVRTGPAAVAAHGTIQVAAICAVSP